MLALIFQVGSDRVALDVHRIESVVPRVRVHVLTHAPAWLAGLMLYQGQVVPVIDLFRWAGAGDCPCHLSSRIILVRWPDSSSGTLIGLLATQVAEIREVEIPQKTTSMKGSTTPNLGLIIPDEGGLLRILEPDTLLSADERGVLLGIAGAGAA